MQYACDIAQVLPPMAEYYLLHSILKLRETEDSRNISLERADSRTGHDPQDYIPLLYDRRPWRRACKASVHSDSATISSNSELDDCKSVCMDDHKIVCLFCDSV